MSGGVGWGQMTLCVKGVGVDGRQLMKGTESATDTHATATDTCYCHGHMLLPLLLTIMPTTACTRSPVPAYLCYCHGHACRHATATLSWLTCDSRLMRLLLLHLTFDATSPNCSATASPAHPHLLPCYCQPCTPVPCSVGSAPAHPSACSPPRSTAAGTQGGWSQRLQPGVVG